MHRVLVPSSLLALLLVLVMAKDEEKHFQMTFQCAKTLVPVTGAVIALPFLTKAIIPYAMAALGTKLSGVGTIHAAGGIAAILQKTTVVLFSWKYFGVATTSGIMGSVYKSCYHPKPHSMH